MAVRNMRYSETAPDGVVSVEEVHIEGLPSGGSGEIADGSVTKAKLAEDVQASLGKADTAMQSAPTKIPEGALVPGAGISLTRGEDETLTCAVKAKGVTAAMLADGVAVSGPKGDKGATGATGPAGVGVKSIALTVDADGKVTGGTLTKTDNTTAAIAVTTATE